METLILGPKLFSRDEPLPATFQSYKHLTLSFELIVTAIIWPKFRCSPSRSGCASSLAMEHAALSHHKTFHRRVPSAGCCATPPSWSHDMRGARHTSADEAGGGAPAQRTPQVPAHTKLSSHYSFHTIHYSKCIELLWNTFQRLNREMFTFFSEASNEKCCFNST